MIIKNASKPLQAYGFKDPQAETTHYMTLGIDGFFIKLPTTGVTGRNVRR